MPAAKKFRFSGIAPELEEKLNMMFSSVVATGVHSCTPHTRSIVVESVDERDTFVDEPVENVEMPAPATEGDASQATKKRKKGKKIGSSAFDALVQSSQMIGQALMQPPKSAELFNITETIEELDRHPEIRDDYKFYDFATILLMDRCHRETFMSL